MIDATQGSTGAVTIDPTIAMLAPASTRRRNRLVLVAGALVLIGAILSPMVLRPSVTQPNGGYAGSWHALPTHERVITNTQVDGQTWPSVEIEAVTDIRGATVAAGWLVDPQFVEELSTAIEAADGGAIEDLSTTLEQIGADRLPARLRRGESAHLVVLWDIDDCGELDVSDAVRLDLGTMLLFGRTESLPDIASPSFDVPTLRESGTCG